LNIQNPVLDVLCFTQSNLLAGFLAQNVPSLSLTLPAKEASMDVVFLIPGVPREVEDARGYWEISTFQPPS
jgi:hypothetical protein